MARSQTPLSFSDSQPASAKVDAMVLGSTSSGDGAALLEGHGLARSAAGAVQEALRGVGAEGGADEVVKLAGVAGVTAPLVLVVGTGKRPSSSRGSQRPADTERLRRAAGVAARALAGKESAVFALGPTEPEGIAAVAEGALLGSYAFQTFHGVGKQEKAKAPLAEVVVHGLKGRSREAKALAERVRSVTDAVHYARDLVNTPPNVLYPESFATSVTQRAAKSKVKVEVWDPDTLAKEGCGGILGVGQGSGRGPRLVTMTYTPSRAKAHLALVGKGITFDSGGLCLKPAASMVTMKLDMAGAAAVAAAVLAVAEQEIPVQVTAYLCLAENMTGELAQRPGDVVTMRGGRTVEIINTDAEGRLVMADGLALASEQQPDAIVDIATLTGACVIALGERTLGVMSNDEQLTARVQACAGAAGEAAWPLPLTEEIRPSMDSPVADLKHTGERAAGAMVAATFLSEFVGKDSSGDPLPWAHLDIAGPAFNDKSPHGYTPKGGTGSGVRALIELARSYAG
ncbi:leucyl aminopeptidase [Ornithinimicrobium sediminis]|uniref:leucyl aminopeptidase n=1 Tax=Ornithinimicrobium sediminis TaxID=2904603 RepID=UPI001E610217|nr:leucyl aminopeptidase [Ornithinimicrobium sediminis]MCE0488052.1 leucyl aminopeptidase [Ornithinimicrobium sediminis]